MDVGYQPVYSFPHQGRATSGAAWSFADNTIYVVDSQTQGAWQYNPVTGELIDRWGPVRGPLGCEIDGDDPDILWVTGLYGIDKYRISTKTRIESGLGPSTYNGIAAPSGPYLWAGKATSPYALLKVSKDNGATIASYPMDLHPSGVAWDFNNGWVWVSGRSTSVMAFDPVAEVFVYEFKGPSNQLNALTYDGRYLWTGDDVSNLIVKFAIITKLMVWPKVNGAWKPADIFVKQGGSWKFVDEAWIKKDGVWKPIIS